MRSFRTELENPLVEQDILDLERKIALHQEGKIDEEKFRSLRLARGVYGQRQPGVQMVRIKIPYGKLNAKQLNRIANVADKYSTGRLHITTRQDIQIHYVSLEQTPQLWEELERDEITLREACGNTVRNVTASELSGIDPNEAFDVSPYAQATFEYFLRNPVGQELGRKLKVAFSSSDEDTALTYIHDLGFIAKIKAINGQQIRGFKVLVAGGLGSQPRQADVAFEFLEANKILSFAEAVVRVFDRYGERSRRAKARLKFLVKDLGLERFLELVNLEMNAVPKHQIEIDYSSATIKVSRLAAPTTLKPNSETFELWKKTNVIKQKQESLFAIGIRVELGDFYTYQARELADLIETYGGNEIRLTLRQDIQLRHIREDLIPFFYLELKRIGLIKSGYNKFQDITACPGTDTCNLGIASSTGITKELERVLATEFPQFANRDDMLIKISGCMNACGQHNMATIGFQGMSIKVKDLVAPALQVLLGGSTLGNGQGRFADKVIKVPSKRGPEAIRLILNDYEANQESSESFVAYYDRQGEKYFYGLLKELSDVSSLTQSDFVDWGNSETYKKAVGIGECAGVVIDLVATLLLESEEKLENADRSFNQGAYSDAIYFAYSALVNAAKALLIKEQMKTNSHNAIISQFDEHFVQSGKIQLDQSFEELVYGINQYRPSEIFAKQYVSQSKTFLANVKRLQNSSNKLI